ncbi:hypothetical protein XBO1_1400004 [Xenorhabdus bovienii str. oregonense]|uniref:Uncharacterized protein n=1 Tax=Xenorhabdus bovienii str. oregonense TaxID=1398202 RepID=A0A077P2B9_XENBV|nr:hypothetical protein XBO1_1400004 [Xenorhabdus bovienii str. oregonense]
MFFDTRLARAVGVFKLKGSVAGETAIALVTGFPFTPFFYAFSLLTKSTFHFNRCHLISPEN